MTTPNRVEIVPSIAPSIALSESPNVRLGALKSLRLYGFGPKSVSTAALRRLIIVDKVLLFLVDETFVAESPVQLKSSIFAQLKSNQPGFSIYRISP